MNTQIETPTTEAKTPVGPCPLDGTEAYKKGFTAADCPFDEPSDDDYDDEEAKALYAEWKRWNDDFDAAADEAEESGRKIGSVVHPKFRQRYKENGDATTWRRLAG